MLRFYRTQGTSADNETGLRAGILNNKCGTDLTRCTDGTMGTHSQLACPRWKWSLLLKKWIFSAKQLSEIFANQKCKSGKKNTQDLLKLLSGEVKMSKGKGNRH